MISHNFRFFWLSIIVNNYLSEITQNTCIQEKK